MAFASLAAIGAVVEREQKVATGGDLDSLSVWFLLAVCSPVLIALAEFIDERRLVRLEEQVLDKDRDFQEFKEAVRERELLTRKDAEAVDSVRLTLKGIFQGYLAEMFQKLQLSNKERILLYLVHPDYFYLVSWYSTDYAKMRLHRDRRMMCQQNGGVLRVAYMKGFCYLDRLGERDEGRNHSQRFSERLKNFKVAAEYYEHETDDRAGALMAFHLPLRSQGTNDLNRVGIVLVESYTGTVPYQAQSKKLVKNWVDEDAAKLLSSLREIVPTVQREGFLSAHPELLRLHDDAQG